MGTLGFCGLMCIYLKVTRSYFSSLNMRLSYKVLSKALKIRLSLTCYLSLILAIKSVFIAKEYVCVEK